MIFLRPETVTKRLETVGNVGSSGTVRDGQERSGTVKNGQELKRSETFMLYLMNGLKRLQNYVYGMFTFTLQK